jgi:hypothetical protein
VPSFINSLWGILNFVCERGQFTFLAMLAHHWQLRNESSVEPSAIGNHEDYCGNKLVTISIVFIILNCVFVILRFYARSITKNAYGWDDYLIIASFISNISLCAVSISMYALFYHLPLSLWYQFASHAEKWLSN